MAFHSSCIALAQSLPAADVNRRILDFLLSQAVGRKNAKSWPKIKAHLVAVGVPKIPTKEAFQVGFLGKTRQGDEFIFHLTPEGTTPLDRLAVGIPYADKSNIARWGHTSGQDLKCMGNTWFIPYKTISRRATDRPHPATFPTAVATQCIKLHGKNGSSVVMDPFLGIGHSALAAAECKVAGFVGFDIERSYVEVSRDELIEIGSAPKVHLGER